ncbi:hypothetical protein ES702_01253 [subsurface metagenome]
MILKKLKKDKKGDFTSLVIMIAVVFGLALALIIFSKVFLTITGELKDTDEFSTTTIATIETVEDNTIPLLDFFIFFSLVALMIGLIISSIYIDAHPAMTVIFLIALIVAVFITGQLANVYAEVVEDTTIASTASQFTYTNLILGEHFPIIILVLGIIIVIILFGKSSKVGEV